MLGWAVLSQLKQDSATRHIPVQIVTVDEERHHSLERGAFAYLAKPATSESIDDALERIRVYTLPRTKRLLIVEDDERERMSIEELIGHDDVAIDHARAAPRRWRQLVAHDYDCVVLDLRLPDMSGFELLDRIEAESRLRQVPIVVFTGKDLSAEEDAAPAPRGQERDHQGRRVARAAARRDRAVPAPRDRRSADAKQKMVQRLHESDETLRNKRVLVVDDDVRNIFALSSVLERHGMGVVTAETGQEAIEKVADDRDIDLVLMDIMMPGMDGYDTMRAIRAKPDSRALPIIALTAKAMKGDREKCLEAGASDYLAKPVVTDQLLGVLRQWLHR